MALGMGGVFVAVTTAANAGVPASQAGLAAGLLNASQQLGSALGLAVLSTLAANRTKGLLSAHHGVTSSLIGGYHLAFIVGAATITAGIVLAFALLRPRRAQPGLQLADTPAPDDAALTHLEIEREAA